MTEGDPTTVSSGVETSLSATEASLQSIQFPLNATWQIQYSGEMDYSLDVDVYDLDLNLEEMDFLDLNTQEG